MRLTEGRSLALGPSKPWGGPRCGQGDGKTAPLKVRNAGSHTALVSTKAVALPTDLGPEGRPRLSVFEKFGGRFQTSALPPASPAQGGADRGWDPRSSARAAWIPFLRPEADGG